MKRLVNLFRTGPSLLANLVRLPVYYALFKLRSRQYRMELHK